MKQFDDVIVAMPTMNEAELMVAVEGFRRELLQLRLKAAVSPVKTVSSDTRFLKRTIAKGLTYLQQKRQLSAIK